MDNLGEWLLFERTLLRVEPEMIQDLVFDGHGDRLFVLIVVSKEQAHDMPLKDSFGELITLNE